MAFTGGFSGGGVGPQGPQGEEGPRGDDGLPGVPGIWVNSIAFTQPAVLGTVNVRWQTIYLTPAVGMILAGAPGVYEVTADVGGGFFELTCLEIRGVAQGANVPGDSVFGQAAPS